MSEVIDTPESEPTPQHRPKRWRSFIGNILLLVLAPLIAILLTSFVFQSYQVDGLSMQNTLQDKDRLIVWKGSRTWARIIGTDYIPNRGDIVIANLPPMNACGQDAKQIVKRVIGLPGDHVTYKGGHYTVYNAEHPSGFNPDTTLPYGKADTALLSDPASTFVDVKLEKDQLFISGDHRANSCDSRAFGPIDADQIVGKLIARIYPLSDAERF